MAESDAELTLLARAAFRRALLWPPVIAVLLMAVGAISLTAFPVAGVLALLWVAVLGEDLTRARGLASPQWGTARWFAQFVVTEIVLLTYFSVVIALMVNGLAAIGRM